MQIGTQTQPGLPAREAIFLCDLEKLDFTCQVCSEWIVRQPGPSEAAGPRRGGNRQGIPTASQPSRQVEAPEEESEPHEDDERVDPPSEEHDPYDMNTSEEDTD